jgi:hypothetical protein
MVIYQAIIINESGITMSSTRQEPISRDVYTDFNGTLATALPIMPLSTDGQAETLNAHNAVIKAARKKIPLCIRNINTGWPLLQASMLYSTGKPNEYMPVLGGGKCHDAFIQALSLISLLAITPGNKSARISGHVDIDKIEDYNTQEFLLENINRLKDGVTFHHKTFQIEIAMVHGAYGVTLEVTFQGDKLPRIRDALMRGAGYYFGQYNIKEEELLTKDNIEQSIDKETTLFYQGQAFVDLLLLLNKHVPHPTDRESEFIELLQHVFKVEEYKEMVSIFYPIAEAEKSAHILAEENEKKAAAAIATTAAATTSKPEKTPLNFNLARLNILQALNLNLGINPDDCMETYATILASLKSKLDSNNDVDINLLHSLDILKKDLLIDIRSQKPKKSNADIMSSPSIKVAKETIKLMIQLQNNSKNGDITFINDYKNSCNKITSSSKTKKIILAVIMAVIGFIVGAVMGVGIGAIAGTMAGLTIGASVGAAMGSGTGAFISGLLLFKPSPIICDIKEVEKNANKLKGLERDAASIAHKR